MIVFLDQVCMEIVLFESSPTVSQGQQQKDASCQETQRNNDNDFQRPRICNCWNRSSYLDFNSVVDKPQIFLVVIFIISVSDFGLSSGSKEESPVVVLENFIKLSILNCLKLTLKERTGFSSKFKVALTLFCIWIPILQEMNSLICCQVRATPIVQSMNSISIPAGFCFPILTGATLKVMSS